MVGRLWDICRGASGLPPAIEQGYRDQWLKTPPCANGHSDPQLNPQDCPHFGDEIEGKYRECPSCNGTTKLKLFVCKHPLQPKGPEVTFQDCLACPVLKGIQKQTVALRFPHGLGDAVMFRRVLGQLAKAGWTVDLCVNQDYHPLFDGLVRSLHPLDHPLQGARTVQWAEGRGTYADFAPTKTARCLFEEFGLTPETGDYPIIIPQTRQNEAQAFLEGIPKRNGIVAIHYEGRTCPQKNMPADVVARACNHLIEKGYTPLILDLAETPELVNGITVFRLPQVDLVTLAAILRQTTLNIMVDSGPHKLASGTKLISVWPTSSPIHYVDEPGQEIFLVPVNHPFFMEQSNGVQRQCNPDVGMAFFRSRYRHVVYTDLGQALCDTIDFAIGPDGGKRPVEPTGERIVIPPAPPVRKLLLHTGLPPGDVMTLTATVQVLHEQYPGRFLTAVSSNHPELWEHNPNVVEAGDDFERVEMHYHTVNESGNRPVHFIGGYTEMLADYLSIKIKQTTNRPHLFISDQEKSWMNQVWEETGSNAPFWILNAGVKSDYTAKQYPWFQEVVDLLRGRVRFAQIGKESDIHPPLRGVVNLIGKTSDRALVRLVYWCQGVLSGVTFLMHLAAAFEKPAVIVAGGREPRMWNSYPCQTLLATIGATWAPEDGCCRTGGCWKSRVTPEQNDGKRDGLCVRPMPTSPPSGECMTKISPELVAKAVESYL